MTHDIQLTRRSLLRAGGATTAATAATLGLAGPAFAEDNTSEQTGEIYQLQAKFHLAKDNADIDLMMSLWDPAGRLIVVGNPHSPFTGADQLRAFWLGSGSFTHRRFSLVPSTKIRIDVHGQNADLYFECHDVADYDQPTRAIVFDSYLSGRIRKLGSRWVFADMTAGSASPLSVDHYYA